MGGDRAEMYFFFKFATKSLEKKKEGGPVAPPTGDRPLSSTLGATGPCRPLGATGSCVLNPGQQSLLNCTWSTKPIELHKIPPASEDLL